eukprot:CAMPEP_0198329660 /NCGR_PEP_ID=MMETSP1450-20131203/16360_1 /TAXON_ID=753684 ORGANISM="Madagascaria erythrocladiodes, Strain CCMP3234" /NCGR_SAMPLE_ID=MMETSP1450 /ASSEMBLY_ACC=CAM_ASM_001115 /LENGTH=577 /DNA_ID=CAMNT_0044033901 /DNA_START=261 /DNA_END=1994 /DNA_ORIENTATION=-
MASANRVTLAIILGAFLIANSASAIDCANGSKLKANASCENTQFSGTDFNRIDVRFAKFAGSTFEDVMFDNGATAEGASFRQTTWKGSSTFEGTNINAAPFDGSSIETINFSPAALNTSFLKSSMDGISVTGTLNFDQASASGSSYKKSTVKTFEAKDSDFSSTSFTSSNIDKLTVSGGTFVGSDFGGASVGTFGVTGSSFSPAQLDDMTIGTLNVQNSDFTKADFSRSKINGGTLSGSFGEAMFGSATIKGVTFKSAGLQRTNFAQATLEDVTFMETDMTGATFRGATLKDVKFMSNDMTDVDLVDITQEGVTIEGVGENCCNACSVLACECREGCGVVTEAPAPATAAPSSDAETPEPTVPGATPEPTIPGETEGPDGDDDDDDDDTSEEDDGVCFPATATVELEDGSLKAMEHLQVGDRVRVSSGEFSDVFFFSHRLATTKHQFVQITAEDSSVVTLTASHYLYLNGALAPSKSAQVGDSIKTSRSGDSIIKSVERVVSRGLYNPHTRHGDVVVNGVVTSTFTTFVPPSLASALLYPEKLATRFGLSIYGSLLHGDAPAPLLALLRLVAPQKSA